MSTWRRITLTVLGAWVVYLLMPGEAEPPLAVPTSVLGPAPPLEPVSAAAAVAAPVPTLAAQVPAAAAQVPAARAGGAPVSSLQAVMPGPFAPRPRPPAVIAYGAAAPLAAGQDVSGYWWGGVKPDLSD